MQAAAATGGGALEVRRAGISDLPQLTKMLVRAYIDDPVAVWICKSSPLRASVLEELYSVRLQKMLAHGCVWTNSGRSSAAVWTAPNLGLDAARPSARLVRCFSRPRLLARVPMLALGFSNMQRLHPKDQPHWYLSLLATDPDARGRGLGSAMLGPVLEQCDNEGIGAYLESSKPRNIDFYTRHGFEVVGELRLPHGPPMWPMWREPSERRH
jgi:ribosomal protein S18 acetylase RimI-like enzyme